jgi:LPXTG-motif cell wall-anchored protein
LPDDQSQAVPVGLAALGMGLLTTGAAVMVRRRRFEN